ncbi:Pex8p Ecym_5267 [Eremothecium cymbalariae DBVPG|uniref:Uncharacterized protein n=1 Tax=Eremothecium cymbalariae (strain CBS 270.75 / DBVPG 7215 / KCTC 17166 / NRRL Y-17582) TaxID=931890 RepID=I6ND89_ERECY|nr:hypothetical protein Ecym_5267 [Eremothecium cymbalariae DBVPG\
MRLIQKAHEITAMVDLQSMQREVDFLITMISNKSLGEKSADQLGHNLVYYTPRIQESNQLKRLIWAFFNSNTWNTQSFDVLKLHEIGQALFEWKLKISEPTLSIGEFYYVWHEAFSKAHSWTLPQLAILSGVLSTKQTFLKLQRQFFIDETGSCEKLYRVWKLDYFLPVWKTMLKHNLNKTMVIDNLALLYVSICEETDKGLNWNILSQSLLKLATQYIINRDDTTFLNGWLSDLSLALKFTLHNSAPSIISKVLDNMCQISYDLSQREMNHSETTKYAEKYHSNVMFMMVLITHGCVVGRRSDPKLHHQVLMVLFYMNYIVRDFGTVGFQTYQQVYSAILSVLTKSLETFDVSLKVMQGNIWTNGNNINMSRILFMLEFMEASIPTLRLEGPYVEHALTPVIQGYISSPVQSIREGAHSVELTLFKNMSSSKSFIEWKMNHWKSYLELAISQFFNGLLIKTQVLAIYETLVAQLPHLTIWNHDLTRELLQFTYSKIINCPKIPMKVALCECLILQCKNITDKYICDWLDNSLELINQIPQPDRHFLLDKQWDFVKNSRNDLAIQWWYTHGLVNRL